MTKYLAALFAALFVAFAAQAADVPATITLNAKPGNVTFPHKAPPGPGPEVHRVPRPRWRAAKIEGFGKDKAHGTCVECHKKQDEGPDEVRRVPQEGVTRTRSRRRSGGRETGPVLVSKASFSPPAGVIPVTGEWARHAAKSPVRGAGIHPPPQRTRGVRNHEGSGSLHRRRRHDDLSARPSPPTPPAAPARILKAKNGDVTFNHTTHKAQKCETCHADAKGGKLSASTRTRRTASASSATRRKRRARRSAPSATRRRKLRRGRSRVGRAGFFGGREAAGTGASLSGRPTRAASATPRAG